MVWLCGCCRATAAAVAAAAADDAIALFNRCKAGLKPDSIIMVRHRQLAGNMSNVRVQCASIFNSQR
jgi:hypothetical protein